MTWDKAPCRFCGTGCHVQVGVKSGKVSAVKKISKSQVAVEFTLTDGTKEPVTFYKDCGDSPHRVGTSWLPQLHQAGLSLW